MTAQPALVPRPGPPRLLSSRRYAPLLAEEAKYTSRQLKTRSHCDECVVALHEAGGKGPAPLPVRWRRTSESGHVDLCMPHKQQWAAKDGTDEKKRKAKR